MEKTKPNHPQLPRKWRPCTGDTFNRLAVDTDTHYLSSEQTLRRTRWRSKKSMCLPHKGALVNSRNTIESCIYYRCSYWTKKPIESYWYWLHICSTSSWYWHQQNPAIIIVYFIDMSITVVIILSSLFVVLFVCFFCMIVFYKMNFSSISLSPVFCINCGAIVVCLEVNFS